MVRRGMLMRICMRGMSKGGVIEMPEKVRLFYGFLKAQPMSSKFASELPVFEESFSQYGDALSFLNDPGEKSEEDIHFYKQEMKLIVRKAEAELARLLPEVLEEDEKESTDLKGIFMEFRPAAGGSEAFHFATELAGYYAGFLRSWGFRTELQADKNSKTIKVSVKGERAYDVLRWEGGVHKVIRVPELENPKQKIHSSTISIAVLPDVPFEFEMHEKDLKFEYMRAQGPGGQHVNKTESACRVTHVPTGTSVHCQDERSQLDNRIRAIKLLREKIFQEEFRKKMEIEQAQRKGQMGSGERSDKIRTYQYIADKITDHRLNKTWNNLMGQFASGDAFRESIEELAEQEKKAKETVFFQKLKSEQNKQ